MRQCTRVLAAVLLVLSSAACRSGPRYTVTSTPINLLGSGHPGFCIAIDPGDPHGVWTWEPAPSGCAKRSTGPGVFHPDGATVTTLGGSKGVEIHFQIQLQQGSPRNVNLVLQGGVLRDPSSDAHVATEPRADLDIPDLTGKVR